MIKRATVEDLDNPSFYSMGLTFFKEANLPWSFNASTFRANIKHIVACNQGAVFLLVDSDQINGAIGGVIHPDICDGSIVAQELFWFVNPTSRGKMSAFRLYEAFENWAVEQSAARISMTAVCNEYLGALRKFYEKRGFAPKDVTFFKKLKA